MSYNDGDVSMASFRDDSFEMSVDHDPIDIVWRSTQVPAMESLLEESKLYQQQKFPTRWNSEQANTLYRLGPSAPKSLFKDANPSHTSSSDPTSTLSDPKTSRRTMNRADSQPVLPATSAIAEDIDGSKLGAADLRKVRPSQRRSRNQTSAVSEGGPTPTTNDSVLPTQVPPIENLNKLQDMIKSVGRSWSQESSISSTHTSANPRRTAQSTQKTKDGHLSNRSRTTSGSRPTSSSKEANVAKEPVKTLKFNQPNPIANSKVAKESRGSASKGLMLPPPPPIRPRTLSEDTSNAVRSDTKLAALRADTWSKAEGADDSFDGDDSMEMDDGDESPSARYAVRTSEPESPSPTARTYSQIGGQDQPQHLLFADAPPKKSLGMRRTLSGTGIANSSSTVSSIQNKPKLSLNAEVHSRPKPFKVPWSNGPSPSHTTSSVVGSSSPFTSGSDSASLKKSSSQCHGQERTFPESFDSSYSFDEIDTEELNRVLSQYDA